MLKKFIPLLLALIWAQGAEATCYLTAGQASVNEATVSYQGDCGGAPTWEITSRTGGQEGLTLNILNGGYNAELDDSAECGQLYYVTPTSGNGTVGPSVPLTASCSAGVIDR